MFSRVPSRSLSNYKSQQQANKAGMKHFNESIDRNKKMRSERKKDKVIVKIKIINTEIPSANRLESDIILSDRDHKEKCQKDDGQKIDKNWFYKDDPDEFEQFCMEKRKNTNR